MMLGPANAVAGVCQVVVDRAIGERQGAVEEAVDAAADGAAACAVGGDAAAGLVVADGAADDRHGAEGEVVDAAAASAGGERVIGRGRAVLAAQREVVGDRAANDCERRSAAVDDAPAEAMAKRLSPSPLSPPTAWLSLTVECRRNVAPVPWLMRRRRWPCLRRRRWPGCRVKVQLLTVADEGRSFAGPELLSSAPPPPKKGPAPATDWLLVNVLVVTVSVAPW